MRKSDVFFPPFTDFQPVGKKQLNKEQHLGMR